MMYPHGPEMPRRGDGKIKIKNKTKIMSNVNYFKVPFNIMAILVSYIRHQRAV